MLPFFTRLKFAFKTFFAVLFHGRIPDDVAITVGGATPREPVAAPASMPAPAKAEPTAAQMLAVLQRDGRLIDFLMEDIAPYSTLRSARPCATCTRAVAMPCGVISRWNRCSAAKKARASRLSLEPTPRA
jgi:hypothetical protein